MALPAAEDFLSSIKVEKGAESVNYLDAITLINSVWCRLDGLAEISCFRASCTALEDKVNCQFIYTKLYNHNVYADDINDN